MNEVNKAEQTEEKAYRLTLSLVNGAKAILLNI